MAKTFGLEVHEVSPAEIKAKWPLLNVDDVVGGVFLPNDGQTNPIDTTMALSRARRCAARASSRTSRSRRSSPTASARAASSRTRARSRPTSSCSRPASGRAQLAARRGRRGAAAGLRAFLYRHRAVPRPDHRSAGAARSRQLRLLQGGRRQAAARRLRAQRQALGGRRACPRISNSANCPRISTISRRSWRRRCAACRRSRRSASASSSTARRASRPTCATCSARRPELQRPLRRRRLQLDRHPVGRRRRQGARRMDRRGPSADGPLGHRHPPPAAVPGQPALSRRARDRIARPALRDALALSAIRDRARRCASRRCIERLADRGACFGEVAGWERANWFAPSRRQTPAYRYSYGRQNWFEPSAAEHRAVREAVGLFDMTSFGKFLVQGRDAEARAAAHLRQRRRRRAGPHRLHAMAQRARRHRGRSHGHAALRARLHGRHRGRDGAARLRLADAPHSAKTRMRSRPT